MVELSLNQIVLNKFGLRDSFEVGLEDLIESIEKHGLLEPLVVRPIGGEKYEVVAGNRRYLALKKLGWSKVQCHIKKLDDKEAFEVALTENIQRENMTPLEEAKAFKTYVKEKGWGSVTELAKKIGKSQGYISQRLKLLKLPEEVKQKLLVTNNFPVSHAVELAHASIPDKAKIKVAEAIEKHGLTEKG